MLLAPAHCYYTTVMGHDFLATWYFRQIYWQPASIFTKSLHEVKKVGMFLGNWVLYGQSGLLDFLVSTLEQTFMCVDLELIFTVASQLVHSYVWCIWMWLLKLFNPIRVFSQILHVRILSLWIWLWTASLALLPKLFPQVGHKKVIVDL